jgi:type I restriction enzyme R subunit
MSKIGDRERISQDRVVKLFSEKLKYDYLGDWEERPNNSNIETSLLTTWLKKPKQGYSDTLIKGAIFEIKKAADEQGKKLYDVNEKVYNLLRYGIKVKESAGENHQTVWLIDWDDPFNNDFAIAEEVTVKGENTKRPDVVIYVNGIAVGVIELKRGKVDVTKGITQNLDNQKSLFIQSFFTTMQLVMAGNDSQGVRYGTIETKGKYYLTWKEIEDPKYVHLRHPEVDSLCEETENLLDQHLIQLCYKRRLIEMMRDYLVFDLGTKKLCRHNQYFGLQSAHNYVKRREGGIYWHTQGSGKSLSMVWLAKWILSNVTGSRVLIITDRTELDDQIEGVFVGIGESIYRTKSGIDLINQLNTKDKSLMSSLIHKFGRKSKSDEGDYKGFIEELRKSLPKNFSAKGDIYVFIDECHRTQSGKLHDAMKEILGDAVLFGFTGTPLLKKDKQKSIEIFGSYIHSYKFDEAVADGVVLDLHYEARDIEQRITDQMSIDQWFDAETKGLNDFAKVELKRRWGTMQKVLSAKSRLEKIVYDIIKDFKIKPRLSDGQGNAILVSSSIYQACKYYELFQQQGFTKCAIITSYEPNPSDIKGENTGEEALTEKLKQYDIYKKMLGKKTAEAFEKEAKKTFVKQPAQMKLLIVVDKLLTGFDAPSATYLYIDKSMQDHGLFQAICRVNRLDGPSKDYGYIIDYKDLFRSIEDSIHDYTTEAFGEFDGDDVKGLLKDRLQEGKIRLDISLESIKAFCEPVDHPKEREQYFKYFHDSNAEGEELKKYEMRRVILYKLVVSLIRAYANIANEMEAAGYTAKEAKEIKVEVKYYEDLRTEIKIHSGDQIDLKLYEPGMRQLLDMYIHADPSQTLSAFEDMTLIQLIVDRGEDALDSLPKGIRNNQSAMAETIENNIRRLIIEESPTNPKYYEKLSILLKELVDLRKQDAIDYKEYLKQVLEVAKNAANPSNSKSYPDVLVTKAQQSLYDNLDNNEVLALAIDSIVLSTKKHGWKGHHLKEKKVLNAIKKHIPKEKIDAIFEIIKKQKEYD